MADEIHARILKGVGAHALGVGIAMFARIIYPPLFLRAWGVDLYGEWLMLTSAVMYLALVDFGGQMYVANRLAEAYAKNELELFKKLLNTGLAVFVLLPTVAFILFMIVITWGSPTLSIPLTQTPTETLFWVLAILAFQICLSLPLGMLSGVYRAVGMLPRSAMLNNWSQLLQLALVSLGLWLSWGMVAIAAMHAIPIFIIGAVTLRELRERFPGLISFHSADWRMAKGFIVPSAHFFSIQLSQALTFQGALLIVGVSLGAMPVVLFSAMRTVTNSMRQVLATFANSVWPEMTRLFVRDETEKLQVLFRVTLRATMVSAVIFIAIFHYFGDVIFIFWLGNKVVYQQVYMDLFLIYVFQMVFWTSCSNLLMSINKHHELAILLLVTAVCTIAFVFMGAKFYGLAGVIGGLILADLLLPLWILPLLVKKHLKSFSFGFFVAELFPIGLALSFIFFSPWVIPIVGIGLIVWMIRGMPAGVVNKLLGRFG